MSVHIAQIQDRRFNAAAAKPFLDRMKLAWAPGVRVVVLDFAEVVSIDSLGISALVAAHRTRPEGGRIVVCCLNDYVRNVLEITRMVHVFDVYESSEAAAKAA